MKNQLHAALDKIEDDCPSGCIEFMRKIANVMKLPTTLTKASMLNTVNRMQSMSRKEKEEMVARYSQENITPKDKCQCSKCQDDIAGKVEEKLMRESVLDQQRQEKGWFPKIKFEKIKPGRTYKYIGGGAFLENEPDEFGPVNLNGVEPAELRDELRHSFEALNKWTEKVALGEQPDKPILHWHKCENCGKQTSAAYGGPHNNKLPITFKELVEFFSNNTWAKINMKIVFDEKFKGRIVGE